MNPLSVFCIFFVAINVCAQDTSFSSAINKYVTDCAKNTPTDGRMTVSYFTIDAVFKTMDSVYVKQFDPPKQLRRYSPSEVLMQAACICTEVAMNSYEIIVSPMIIQGKKVDALTLCAFHDRSTDLGEVMDFPINFLNSWLHAQFWAQMPRTLFAPVGSIPVVSCIGTDGHPTQLVPGQNACYYVNYAKFERQENDIEVDHKVYYGPFLGTQVPNFAELVQHSESKISTLDFATLFDFVKCSMLKTKTRLSAGMIETGCKFRAYPEDWSKLVIVTCCCDGHDDPNCAEVTSAVKEKKILCFDGTLTPNARFYFANECPYTVSKQYRRIIQANQEEDIEFKHAQAVKSKGSEISFNDNNECSSTTITCENALVNVNEKRCCSGVDFCGVHHGLMGVDQKCYWNFGEDQMDDGCFAVFYRANDQWYRSAPIWFDMKKSTLYHLYTSHIDEVEYDVSFGFLAEKNVESSCYEKTHEFNRDYYVVNCADRACDYSFQSGLIYQLDEKALRETALKAEIPRCENGSISFVTEDAALDKLPHLPDTTRVVGQFCMTRLKMGLKDNNKVIDITFGPVHRIPKDCNAPMEDVNGGFVYKCCHKAGSDSSHIEENCHYSTILAVVNGWDNDDEADVVDEDIPDTMDPEPATALQLITELTDNCEQNRIGHAGTPSTHCSPGGHGCFHINKLFGAKDKVIASCIGRAEQLIAARKKSFDRYHEALICLTDEAKGKCHLVHSGTRMRYLCCCEVTNVKNGVASCAVDSNMLYNTVEFEIKYVGDFKDDNGES